MVHTVIIVTEPKVSVEVPLSLVGKEVDVIVTERVSKALADEHNSEEPLCDMSEFAGSLKMSDAEYKEFLDFVDEGRGQREYD